MKKPFSTKIKEDLYDKFKKLADETRIPMARLLEEAIDDLLKKHNKKTQ